MLIQKVKCCEIGVLFVLRSMFINSLSFMISGCSNFIIFFFPRKMPQIFNTCSNLDPADDYIPSNGEGHIDIFSLALFMAVNARIAMYKWSKNDPGQKFFILENKSILNLTSLIVNLITFALLAFLSLIANRLTLKEMNEFPHYLVVYSMQLIGPPVVCNVILGFQFIRHKNLRKFVITQAKELF